MSFNIFRIIIGDMLRGTFKCSRNSNTCDNCCMYDSTIINGIDYLSQRRYQTEYHLINHIETIMII